jgi:putative chitinase
MTPIDMITPSLLLQVVTGPRQLAELEPWAEAIKAACLKFEINTIRRVAAFIAQMAHESDLRPRAENLNYSVEGLMKTFSRSRISAADCERYGRCAAHPADQQAIANCIYGGEFGLKELGNSEPGDGWLCRGGGPLQATGRGNYTRFAQAMGKPLVDTINWVRNTVEGGVMFAAWFWEENDINRLADTPGVSDETRRINGGVLGLQDRKTKFDRLVDAMLRLQRKEPA